MQRHNARLAGAILLLRINPTDAIDLALLVVHALDKRTNSIARKGRTKASVDIRKNQLHNIRWVSWRCLQKLNGLRAQRRFAVKRDLFALDLHSLSGDHMQPVAFVVLLDLVPSCFACRRVACRRQDGKGQATSCLTNRHQLHQSFKESRHTFWRQCRLMTADRSIKRKHVPEFSIFDNAGIDHRRDHLRAHCPVNCLPGV